MKKQLCSLLIGLYSISPSSFSQELKTPKLMTPDEYSLHDQSICDYEMIAIDDIQVYVDNKLVQSFTESEFTCNREVTDNYINRINAKIDIDLNVYGKVLVENSDNVVIPFEATSRGKIDMNHRVYPKGGYDDMNAFYMNSVYSSKDLVNRKPDVTNVYFYTQEYLIDQLLDKEKE